MPRSNHVPQVLSLVENGWRGARECSLILKDRKIHVTHLIKGKLTRDLLELIHPYLSIRIISVSRNWFRLALWWHLIRMSFGGNLKAVLVDQPKTQRQIRSWCSAFGITICFIEEMPDGYRLWQGQSSLPVEAIPTLCARS